MTMKESSLAIIWLLTCISDTYGSSLTKGVDLVQYRHVTYSLMSRLLFSILDPVPQPWRTFEGMEEPRDTGGCD